MHKSRVIGVVGSRRRNSEADFKLLQDLLNRIWREGDTFVSGGCSRGADRFIEIMASDSQVPITIHRADWKTYGKVAGFMRNTLIAQDCDILVAMVAEDRTGGTEDTLRKAESMGKEVILV